jgi:hypothetical protein
MCVLASPAYAKYGGGSGTAEDPYLINTAEQMNAIGTDANDWDKHFKLTADVNLSGYTGTQFNIIGYYDEVAGVIPFAGVFDGNNHTISNFTYDSNGSGNIGIFGYISGGNAEIKNLGLRDPNVWAQSEEPFTCYNIGSLVGRAISGTISNCYVEGGSVTGRGDVGALVGDSESGTSIANCHANCSVTATNNTGGGLIGENDGYIIDCYAIGGISGLSTLGGLAGCNGGPITDCYATGNVNGERGYLGGLVGRNYFGGGMISDCHATGNVTSGSWEAGGLAGSNSGTISNSFATGIASAGESEVGGLVGYNMGEIFNCFATGGVTAPLGAVGGLIGWNEDNGVVPNVVSNCYSTGSASCSTCMGGSAGGLVGINYGLISECYSIGDVSGVPGEPSSAGGLVGAGFGGVCEASFWDVETSGQTNSEGGTGRTTAQMQKLSTFSSAGWDFVEESTNGTEDIWRLCPDGVDYPRFVWQNAMSGDFVCADGVYMLDLAHLAAHWLEEDCNDANGHCEGTDLNKSGGVNFPDYGLFAENWRTGLTPFVLDEDFETGDFSKYNWQHADDANWTVVSDVNYEGGYSAKSGLISHNEESVLKITLPIEDGSVSFYHKVSSESDEDYLRFYIDNDQQGNWSGEQDWSLQQYAITSGLHTLKWVYEKDVSISSGSDCAWIDKITITGVMP